MIKTETVNNQYGKHIKIHVNIPEFTETENVIEIQGGHPLIPLYEYTGEHTIKECVECGKKFVAHGNTKTCPSMLCKKKLEKNTKDKCNKKVI